MPFTNRVRLPIQLHSAQFPEERNVFRKANGATQTLSVVVRKQYELETDYLPEKWHERLKMALAHDTVILEGERYLGEISQDGDYNIEWPDGVLHYPTAKAGVTVQVTPFEATNDNCQTCEEATQLDLENDTIEVVEDEEYIVDVADNDSICCYPATFSITSFNSDYLSSATIDPETGVVTMQSNADLTSINGVVLVTYRVTCPNGGYDEANIIGNVTGSTPGCLAPTSLSHTAPTGFTHSFSWTDDPENPVLEYYYEIYEGSEPVGTPIVTGTVDANSISDIPGFTPGEDYYFQIRSVCEDDITSNFVGLAFTQPATGVSCGSYSIYNGDIGSAFKNFTYTDCSGNKVSSPLFALNTMFICALETSPGVYASIAVPPLFTITYNEPC